MLFKQKLQDVPILVFLILMEKLKENIQDEIHAHSATCADCSTS